MRHSIAALGYAKAPSRSRALPLAVLDGPWARLAAVLLVGLLVHLILPAQLAIAVLNPMGAGVGVAAVAGLRRSSSRLAWNLVIAGVALYATADVIGLLATGAGAASVLFLGAYAALAAGFAVFATRLR